MSKQTADSKKQPQHTSKPGPKPKRSLRRRILFRLFAVFLGLFFAGLLGEGVFRVLEHIEASKNSRTGAGGHSTMDNRWGWKPSEGSFSSTTAEFSVTGFINEHGMNDDAIDVAADASKTRVLALGDSHTYAVGVSKDDTWVKQLQVQLNQSGESSFRTYNAGVVGFNLHQYLLRLIDHGPELKPHFVVVGFSYATDLYDLLPPDRGGWIYGADAARDYFDFDAAGNLEMRHWDLQASATDQEGGKPPAPKTSAAHGLRKFLSNFAIFRYLRRSKLALAIGSKLRIGGQSLWPNMDIVLEKQVSPEHEYQWRLAKALLDKIKTECDGLNAKLIVLGIPYLPQVYDEIWDVTFGGDAKYSRTAANERVAAWCTQAGIEYVETLEAFRTETRAKDRWLHHRKDAHPTAEGQALIARVLMDAKIIRPVQK